MALCFMTFDSQGKLKSIQEISDPPPEIRQKLMEDNVRANGLESFEELMVETAKDRVLESLKTNPRISEASAMEVVENFIARHEREQKEKADIERNRAEAERQKQEAVAHALLKDLEELYGPAALDDKLAAIESGDDDAEKVLKEIEEHRVKKQEFENQARAHRENKIAARGEQAERAARLLRPKEKNNDS